MERYYVVNASALPEIFLKVAEAKRLLETGESATIHDATDAAYFAALDIGKTL